jgi:hypothetical protein
VTLDLTFLTTTKNGSYDRLAKRQGKVLEKNGISNEVIELAHSSKSTINGKRVLVYCTFNLIPKLVEMYNLKPENSVFMVDSALITIPYLKVGDLIKKGYRIFTVSQFNTRNFKALGIDINYKPHFIPDPNPQGQIIPLNQRTIDFLTVGINELDFDRKGHYWNWITETWGFKSVRVCSNYCFGKSLTNVNDSQLFDLYRNTKWYLAVSHAETPHLPLLEAYAFGTPSVYLLDHEFEYNGIGIPFMSSFLSVKGAKNFYFSEIDPSALLEAVGDAYTLPDDNYMFFASRAREVFENEYKMENRLSEFRQMIGV